MIAAAEKSEAKEKRSGKPKATWDGILYEFQVFYCAFSAGAANPSGPLQSMMVRAKTASQAGWHLEQAGYQVTSVATGKPVVDWSKPYFTRDEVQAMTGLGETAMSAAITSAALKESSVKGLFSKRAIEDWLDGTNEVNGREL